uniref:F-box domain-containing protein n=1 Tax=Ditylenchus dipsaci TaxID=166011 RepID=A0A915EDQ9_9BILA
MPSIKTTTSAWLLQRSAQKKVPIPRLPQNVLVRVMQYLSVADLATCMRVCRQWSNAVDTYDELVWGHHAKREIPVSALSDPYLFADTRPFKLKLRAFRFAWNPSDSSRNNFVRTNGFTVHRQPVAQSTDGIRGKLGSRLVCMHLISHGRVLWEQLRHAAMHCPGYVPLIGSDDQSWGWNLVDNSLLHNGSVVSQYPRLNNPPKYQIGELVRMVLDCDRGFVYFEKANEFLGLAFAELPPVKLFPAMCAVYGNTEVSMVYVGPR